MKTCYNLIFLLLLFCAENSIAQSFRNGFYNREHSSGGGSGQGASYQSNIGSSLHNNESVFLISYLTMFKATKDKRYLDQFVIQTKRVQERRDDNILQKLLELQAFFPVDVPGSQDCEKDISILNAINSTSKGWSYVENLDCELHDPSIVQSGSLTYPMALFIWNMQSDPDFMDLANEIVPLEAQTVLSSSSCSTTAIFTYQDFANWLECRIAETFDFHESDWDIDEEVFEDETQFYISENLNGNTSLGRTIALMYLITGDPIYHERTTDIAALVDLRMVNNSITVNGVSYPYYTWLYGWGDHHCVEDIGHAYLTMQFAEICFTNGITNFETGLPLFDLSDMQKYANTVAFKIYKEPLDYWQSTAGHDNETVVDPLTPCGTGGVSAYAFLAKYNPYIFQMISDIYCQGALYLEGPHQHLTAYSDLAYLQSKSSEPYNATGDNFKFNPVAVARDNQTNSQTYNMASGDFDGDGLLDFITVDGGPDGGGIFRAYTPQVCNNSDKGGCWEVASSSPHGITSWKGIASGDFNAQIIPFTNPGDEVMALQENGAIYLFKQSGPGFAEWSTTSTYNWSGLTSGNFLPDATDEAVAITATGDIHFITYNTGIFEISNTVGTTSISDVIGITAGAFDATDNRPQVAILDELTAALKIYSYDALSESFLQIHEFNSFGSNNQFTSITSGDFDGDGIDEIVVHRNKDGQMFVLKVKPAGLEHIYSEFFHTDQGIGALTTGRYSYFNDNDELVVYRNFDGQITLFGIQGNCPNLVLNNLAINDNSSIDNTIANIENDYPIDYHVNNTLISSNLTISPNTTVDFTAGHAVVLKTGTTISAGSNFQAYIEPTLACGDDQFLKMGSSSTSSDKGEIIPVNQNKEKPVIDFSAEIFPNPNEGSFTIQLKGIEENQTTNLLIYNSFGEIVYQTSTSNARSTIDLSDQANGIYFVKIQNEGNAFVGKIVIQ